MAETFGDVIATASSSYCSLGFLGFIFTAVSEGMARSGTAGMARTRMPYFVFRAACQSGNRFGRLSAGFSGGRALGQWIRGADDSTTSMIAAITAGIVAADSVAGIPSSVATFACFTYFIDSFTARQQVDVGDQPVAPPAFDGAERISTRQLEAELRRRRAIN